MFINIRHKKQIDIMKIVKTNKKGTSPIIHFSVHQLAAQITLIDLTIFKSIRSDEILNLGYSPPSAKPPSLVDDNNENNNNDHNINNNDNNNNNNDDKHQRIIKNKQQLMPNVVAMNNQFNQVTFWLVGQILSHEDHRSRAELIRHFIKTAKQLHELNNLHSSYAFISALLSSPIFRLDKTWHYLRKKYSKDEQIFQQLVTFFSDTNNYELLRLHLKTSELPCIPYLGVYSRDIIYIKEAYQEGTPQRTNRLKTILHSIEHFQLSEYDKLEYIPSLNSLLLSSRYLDELQKMVQEETYKRSLELEPCIQIVSFKKHTTFQPNYDLLQLISLMFSHIKEKLIY